MPIDFVILWVDGNDPKWQVKKNQYRSDDDNLNSVERYRDYGMLKYWFRMVEVNAPWVNKIHLVTDHQVPTWLDTNHPKYILSIMKILCLLTHYPHLTQTQYRCIFIKLKV